MSVIDGLVSGLDTTGVINELLAIQRAPINRLTARQEAAESQASTIATIRSMVEAVKTAAAALDDPGDWRTVKRSSTDSSIATASGSGADGASATLGSVSFTVDRLATAHQIVSAGAARTREAEWATGDITLRVDGQDHVIAVEANDDSGVRDLDSVIAAVNDANVGVRAQAVQVAPGEYRLQLESTATGAASEFEAVDGLSVGFTTSRQATDARIVLAGGFDATSPTNTFEDLLSGMDVTVKKASTDQVTVSSLPDPDALANKVSSLVTAVNAALAGITTATHYDAATGFASVLTGDSTLTRAARDLTRALVDAVPGSDLGAPGLAGVTLNKDGTFTFDRAKFLDAFEDDPTAVQALFVGTGSVTERLGEKADLATALGTGYLRTAEELRRSQITRLGDQITRIEERVERSALALRKQFTLMETSMGALQSQSKWLAGQIASLPTYNNSQG